jgi:hypothetical protein
MQFLPESRSPELVKKLPTDDPEFLCPPESTILAMQTAFG